MSDLLYDTVQEKAIEEQKESSPVRVVQEEDPPQPVCSISEDRDYDDYRILESD